MNSYVHDIVPDHYHGIASNYDQLNAFQHITTVNFIKHCIPLSKTDQIIDIGGGTGEIIRLLRQDFGIEKPRVCIEPNMSMLQIALKKDSVIPIQSTAEEFLAQMPKFPMKFVLISSVAHHFKDLAGVIANLARYMPYDGICLLNCYPPPASIWFEAVLKKFKCLDQEKIFRILKSNNLHHKLLYWKEMVEIEKQLWYETLHSRYSSMLKHFSDEQIEEGIRELELKFGGNTTLKFEVQTLGFKITKQS